MALKYICDEVVDGVELCDVVCMVVGFAPGNAAYLFNVASFRKKVCLGKNVMAVYSRWKVRWGDLDGGSKNSKRGTIDILTMSV